ncbi:hypothetical protein [Pimelobacter simplex]|uniref:hypothetical protein n=1 Tax=Nocardioides simplex TaxID=2045 RepID=UPI00214F9A92|nr:hypothetical protein [Pimelobacter simplex]UUW91401.1 hypothetical protein M0M43_07905 [Pimelobacter simplex]UUW95229.1 hypothetical protein M0M48_26410 [Pimelobacter simplex]
MTSPVRRLLPPALLVVPATLLALAPVAPAGAAGAAGAVPASAGASSYPAMCDALDLTDETEIDARALPADDVFAGTVRAVQPTAGDAQRVGYLVAVERPFRGDIDKDKQVLVTVDWPADATPTVEKSRAYLFFTNDRGGRVVADPCTGTALLPKGVTPRIAATLRRFLASVEPTAPPSPTPQPVAFSEPSDPAGNPPELGRVLASGGAIALIGVLGLVLVSRLGRRRV